MFVEIVNPKSAILVNDYIRQSRATGFTKWHAFSVLEQSCHYGNIKSMLKIRASHLRQVNIGAM